MRKYMIAAMLSAAAVCIAAPATAKELATVTRVDASTVEVSRDNATPVSVWLSADAIIDKNDRKVSASSKETKFTVASPASERRFIILREKSGNDTVVAERALPLQQGSNFRDIGGYVTKDGHTVRWGKAFRSGAMSMLSDADYALLGQLQIGNVVDLRSLEERELAPDSLDDRVGALFLSNDYSMKPLLASFATGNGENTYQGMEKMLAPQFRALYKRLVADQGAVVYHCSAGQDRTGIATALLYDYLGVDRETILKDYHLSTALRRPQWEMPRIDPKQHADNPLVQMYLMMPEEKRSVAQPLYTPSGASHLAQFFTYLDKEYGGSEGYLKTALGLSDAELVQLRKTMLD